MPNNSYQRKEGKRSSPHEMRAAWEMLMKTPRPLEQPLEDSPKPLVSFLDLTTRAKMPVKTVEVQVAFAARAK
jgi:hypothetical protein